MQIRSLQALKEIFAVVCMLCLIPVYLAAYTDCNQCFDTPWNWPITSDYGPRNVVGGTWFHEGIDYGMPRNTGITPIENGVITYINYVDNAGWMLKYRSVDVEREWQVFHIFTGTSKNTPVYSCPTLPCTNANRTWELRNATLINPDNENDVRVGNIIIQWNGNFAENVYCESGLEAEGFYIRNLDGTYIMSDATTRAVTRSDVVVGVPFAPSGNSGGNYGYHLHLGVNDGNDNPLRYLRHTPDAVPVGVINNPPDKHIFTREEMIIPYPITITVDSTSGLDLDKVDVWVYKGGSDNPGDRIHLPYPTATPMPSSIQNTFQYGGVPGEDRSFNIEPVTSGKSGVIPISETPGTDKFILYQTFKDLNLPAGMHKIVVKAEDVNGNSRLLKKQEV